MRLLLHAVEPANAAADHHAETGAVHFVEVDPRILERHLRSGHRELRESVRALGGLGILEILRSLEAGHLPRDLAVEIRGIERLKLPDPAPPVHHRIPERCQIVPDGADDSDSGDYNSSFAHVEKVVDFWGTDSPRAPLPCADGASPWQ